MDELLKQYREAAIATADASADIAIYEKRIAAARSRYEQCKTHRDELKRKMTDFDAPRERAQRAVTKAGGVNSDEGWGRPLGND